MRIALRSFEQIFEDKKCRSLYSYRVGLNTFDSSTYERSYKEDFMTPDQLWRCKKGMKRILAVAAMVAAVIGTSCGEAPPVAVDVKDVCSQPIGTNVTVQGYFSLPKSLEVTRYTRGGQGAGINYKLILMTKQDASGDAVFVNMSGTTATAPNTIKMLPDNYSWKDLTAFTHDNKTIVAGELAKLTGSTAADEKDRCKVNVHKIEKP